MNEQAELLFTQIFWRIAQQFNQISVFRRISAYGIPHLQAEAIDAAYLMALSNELDDIFLDKKGFFEGMGGVEAFASKVAEIHSSNYQVSVDSASIILAHSILDSVAFDCIRVIEKVAPLEDWEPFVSKRQISLEDLKGLNYETACNVKICKYIEDLERRSILEKIDKLFEICKPAADFSFVKNYKYDRERVDAFDNLRHEIIHGKGLSSPVQGCEKEIEYTKRTSSFLMGLVYKKYGVRITPTLWGESLRKDNKNSTINGRDEPAE